MNIRKASLDEIEKALIMAVRVGQGFELFDAHSVKFDEGVLSVDLINGDPYIVDLTDWNVYSFPSEPGSGTDRLRKRIEARVHTHDLIGRKDRAKYYLSAIDALDEEATATKHLEQGPIVVGLARIVNAGGTFLVSFDENKEPFSFTELNDALHMLAEKENEMIFPLISYTARPRG